LIVSGLYARQPEAIAETRALGASCAASIRAREEPKVGLAGTGSIECAEILENDKRSKKRFAPVS
jgi:hypothetical protein